MLFSVMFFLLLPFILQGIEPDFYVWQREHGTKVETSVRNYYRTSTGKLYFLAGEMENDGKGIAFPPEKYVDLRRAVPVVRIHIRHMKKTPAKLAGELVRFYHPWNGTGEFQIDLDAPESKIRYYRQLMIELRRRLPGVKLSATVLPCHLKHTEEFRDLAKVCDYYVLQVHALTKAGNGWFILDKATAFQALTRAGKLKLPFKTALPFYCNTVGGKQIEPDMSLVAALAKESPGVIGFRLGIPGDGESLDLQTALEVCRSGKYAPALKFFWERQENGVWHFSVRNDGYFSKTVTLNCSWRKKIPYLHLGVFNGAKFSMDRQTLELRLPASGARKPFFWIRSEEPQKTIKITVQK